MGTASAGLVKWKAKQGVADARELAELNRAELEIEAMTLSEIEAVAVTEAVTEHEIEWADQRSGNSTEFGRGFEVATTKDRILSAESRVLTLLQAAFKWSHVAQPHVRFGRGGKTRSIDAFLKAKDSAYVDIIAEVKYLRGLHRLPQTLSEIVAAARFYREITGRLVYPLLIVVMATPGDLTNSARHADEIQRLLTVSPEVQGSSVIVAVLRADELDALEPAEFLAKLPSGIGHKRS